MTSEERALRKIEDLRTFQEYYRLPVSDVSRQAPAAALHSLRDATASAPAEYRAYLGEAVDSYENGAYRGAVLLVWSAVVEHLYSVIAEAPGGLRKIEAANLARFGQSNNYRRVRKKADLLYLGDASLLILGEDAGLFNRNARALLEDRLKTRNLCAHPTGYVIGREEAVVFIESLINNIVSGAMLDWKWST